MTDTIQQFLYSDSNILEDIADKRSAVLKEMQEASGRFLSRAENSTMKGYSPKILPFSPTSPPATVWRSLESFWLPSPK